MPLNIGKIEKYILKAIENDGGIISVIIDPCDYKSEDDAVRTAIQSAEAGADIIAIGGSTGVQGELLDTVTKSIKDQVDVPIVLFPGNIATITRYADAIYFMSLLNSRNPYWISQAQTLAAPIIKKMHVEPLPVGYIVMEPGGTVGWVGDANAIPRNKPQIVSSMALAGQFSGYRIIFTDAGSAAPEPIPPTTVTAVKQNINIPYLVAGGIRTPEQADALITAGADWLQIGTAAEKTDDVNDTIKQFVDAIKKAGRRKL